MNKEKEIEQKQFEESIEQRFLNLYPSYDYSVNSASKEKDVRKKKKMNTMY